MALVVVLAYIALNLLSPADLFPALNGFRPLLVLALASLPLAVLARLQTPEIGRLRVQFALVILFYGWALGSYLPHGRFGANVNTLVELSPNVIAYFVGVFVLGSPLSLRMVRWGMPYALASGASTPYDLVFLDSLHHTGVRIRGLGMLNDPNVFGEFLLMILPMLYVGKKDSGLGVGYVVVIPVTILFLVGVYFTGSRGTEMGVAALVALFLIRRFKAIGVVVSALFGGLLLIVVNATTTRTVGFREGLDRLAIWSDGMAYFKSSPVWGIGWGAFQDRQGMTAHNSFLLCAAELGIVGYFLWMSIIVVTMIQLSRIPKLMAQSNPAMARWASAVSVSLGVYLFIAFFLSRAYELPLFLLFGMAGAIIASAGGDDAVPLRGTGWPLWSFGLCVGTLALIWVMLRLRVV